MEKLNTINQLLNEIQTISESYKRVAEATGENFNIFSVLQMESDEVKTHSRFLAELLNPKGSHGQKDVFLKKFVERFGIETFDTINAKVDVEYSIGKVSHKLEEGGRIDILIMDNNSNPIIMIENKIYAPEQPKQLRRYKQFAPNALLLFLTLDGKHSEDKSINKDDYQCISYQSDILNWLEECRKESVNISILRETITQYINLIKILTGQNINTKMSLDITNRIIKDEQSFETYNKLIKAKEEVRKQIFIQELFPLINEIGKKFNLEIHLNQEQLLNNTIAWNSYFWFENSTLKNLNLLMCFAFNRAKGYQDFIHGFSFKNIDGNKDLFEYQSIKTQFQNSFANSEKETKHWLSWRYFDEYWNFEDLDTLKNIKFGNFKTDFEEKVKAMLAIIDSI
jgi:hypothetical protein